jgi:hypothetical protein
MDAPEVQDLSEPAGIPSALNRIAARVMRPVAAIITAFLLPHAQAAPTSWEWLPGHEARGDGPKTVVAALPRSAADRPDEVTGNQVHVMYVLPLDGVDEGLDTNGRIGTSAAAFLNWLKGQASGRTLRLDTFGGLPDISFHRLSRTDAQLRATGAFVRDEIEKDLRAANLVRNDKLYAVYYGGSSNYSCGGGAYPPTLPGNVAAMYLKGEPPGAPGCATNPLGVAVETPGYLEFGMLHELMHTLGFVASCSPHHHRAGHVFDSANDLMWSGDSPWLLPPRLDIGGDDYYLNDIATCLDMAASPYMTVVPVTSPTPRLGNISTRGRVETGNDVMIGGFVIGGATPKKVLITARGPSLAAFGVTGAMVDPTLQVFSGQTMIAANDNWQTNANQAEIVGTGIAPSNPLEAALMVTLNPGAYTAIVSGAGGGTGVGIIEVFEQDKPEIPLINISTRGQVQTADNVMIGGFIIQGSSPQTVLITARGPSLAPFGITNPLGNPKLEIFSGQTKIFENDDWETNANKADIAATGVAPSDAKESALLVTLSPGAYTAVVSGVGGVTGVGIVEVFAR